MSVGTKVEEIFEKKIASLYAEAQRLAEEALQEMQSKPFTEMNPWKNETRQAMLRLFSDAFQDSDSVGFFVAHGVEYGVYLELANNRQNEILRPTLEKYALKFKLFAQELFGASA